MKAMLIALADWASFTQEGKLVLAGDFNVIWAREVPVRWPRMFLVLKLEAEAGEPDSSALRIDVVNDDGVPISLPLEAQVNMTRFRPSIPRSGSAILQLIDSVFPGFGHYEFRILHADKLLTSTPLYILDVAERA